jgi:hypothetical protein
MYQDYPQQATQDKVLTIQVKRPGSRTFKDFSNGSSFYTEDSRPMADYTINQLALMPEHAGHTFRFHEHVRTETPRVFLSANNPGEVTRRSWNALGAGTEVPGTTLVANEVQKQAAAAAESKRLKDEEFSMRSKRIREGFEAKKVRIAAAAAASSGALSRRQLAEAAKAKAPTTTTFEAPGRKPGRPAKPDSPAGRRAVTGRTQTAADKRRDRALKSGKEGGK